MARLFWTRILFDRLLVYVGMVYIFVYYWRLKSVIIALLISFIALAPLITSKVKM